MDGGAVGGWAAAVAWACPKRCRMGSTGPPVVSEMTVTHWDDSRVRSVGHYDEWDH